MKEETSLFKKLGIAPKQILYLFASDLGFALALNFFYVDNNIAAGGLAGVGTVLNYFLSFPVGLTIFVLNLPIVIWGLTIKGKRYVLISLIATGIYSLFVDLLAFLPCLTDDKIVAVVCGGIIYGASASLSVKAQISTGGTDLLAKLLITKFKTASIGKLYLCIDGSIVALAMVVYGNIESGIYAILAIAVCSLVTDKINSGFNRADVFYIFANKNIQQIANAILYDMGRGATCLNGTGMYANAPRNILMVVVKPGEVPRLKAIVHEQDPSAFIVLTSASEIIGEGFEDLDLTGTINEKQPSPKKAAKPAV